MAAILVLDGITLSHLISWRAMVNGALPHHVNISHIADEPGKGAESQAYRDAAGAAGLHILLLLMRR